MDKLEKFKIYFNEYYIYLQEIFNDKDLSIYLYHLINKNKWNDYKLLDWFITSLKRILKNIEKYLFEL